MSDRGRGNDLHLPGLPIPRISHPKERDILRRLGALEGAGVLRPRVRAYSISSARVAELSASVGNQIPLFTLGPMCAITHAYGFVNEVFTYSGTPRPGFNNPTEIRVSVGIPSDAEYVLRINDVLTSDHWDVTAELGTAFSAFNAAIPSRTDDTIISAYFEGYRVGVSTGDLTLVQRGRLTFVFQTMEFEETEIEASD